MRKFCVIYLEKELHKMLYYKLREEFFQLGRITHRDLFSAAGIDARSFCIIHRSRNVFVRRNKRKHRDVVPQQIVKLYVVYCNRTEKIPTSAGSRHRDPPPESCLLPLTPTHFLLAALFFPSYFFVTFHFAFHYPPPR